MNLWACFLTCQLKILWTINRLMLVAWHLYSYNMYSKIKLLKTHTIQYLSLPARLLSLYTGRLGQDWLPYKFTRVGTVLSKSGCQCHKLTAVHTVGRKAMTHINIDSEAPKVIDRSFQLAMLSKLSQTVNKDPHN